MWVGGEEEEGGGWGRACSFWGMAGVANVGTVIELVERPEFGMITVFSHKKRYLIFGQHNINKQNAF